MRTPIQVVLAGLTIGFAMPVLAQEQNTIDPEVRQQIEALLLKFDDAFNKNDLAAITALYTQDAVLVYSWFPEGTSVGKSAIEKFYRVEFASTPYGLVSKLVQVHAIGNEVSTITEWSATHTMGQAVAVWVRDADTFKIRLLYVKERCRLVNHPKNTGGDNENALSTYPSRFGYQLCFANICTTNKRAGANARRQLWAGSAGQTCVVSLISAKCKVSFRRPRNS